MQSQGESNRVKVGQVQVDAVVAVAGEDDPSLALRVPPPLTCGREVSMQHGRILAGQMTDRHTLDLDADGVAVIRIVMLRNKPGTDRQAVFPAACIPSSRHRPSSADLLESRLVEVLADNLLSAIIGQLKNLGLIGRRRTFRFRLR
jgi:hypothetical protein